MNNKYWEEEIETMREAVEDHRASTTQKNDKDCG